MSGNEKIERELESFLTDDDSRVAALYRKLPQAEPPAHVDAAVLAMARRAVQTRRARSGWMPALSAAAVLLVVAGVAYRTAPRVWEDRGAIQSETAKQAPAASSVAAPAPAAAPAFVPEPPKSERSPAVAGALAKSLDSAAPAKPSAQKSSVRSNAAATPAPPVRESSPQPIAAEMRVERDRTESVAREVSAPSPPAANAPLQSLDSTIFPADALQSEERKKRADSHETRDREKDSAQSSLKSKPAAAPAQAASAPKVRSAPTATSPAQLNSISQTAGAAAPRSDANEHLYPEHWLANIRDLLRDQRRDDAVRSLEAFRRQYPDYRLPDDLRDLK